MKHKHLCDSCQLGNLSWLPFFSCFEHSSTSTFEKIHCNLWGLTHVLSIEKFKYVSCLVDDFFKYTLIILLQHKSSFVSVNLEFE